MREGKKKVGGGKEGEWEEEKRRMGGEWGEKGELEEKLGEFEELER